jgi:hypothetical protein
LAITVGIKALENTLSVSYILWILSHCNKLCFVYEKINNELLLVFGVALKLEIGQN